MSRPSLRLLLLPGIVLLAGVGLGTGLLAPMPVQTTVADFFVPGTQPMEIIDGIVPSDNCAACHGNFNLRSEPYGRWVSSMMAQAGRDPVFFACLTIANQDADFAGDLCLRCHMPGGWLAGRSVPTDGSALDDGLGDFDGVNCNVCHRMVDPVADVENPAVDTAILAGLTSIPPNPHTGSMVIDPNDRRRGPYDLGAGFFWHAWEQSPYHQESNLCGTCHDVSNPVYNRVGDEYVLDTLNAPHPTGDKYDQFPIERTFSEWLMSEYAERPVLVGRRFGGNKETVSSCQDCHMPDTTGEACAPGLGAVNRTDQAQHNFAGSNSWVLHAIRSQYPDSETGLNDNRLAAGRSRNVRMLQRASDMELFERDGKLVVRVINQSGHKLPTGYVEGRRAWLNVIFQNDAGQTIAERGAYDVLTADLITSDTKVYEAKHGLSAAVATATGLPAGEGFHFALNNTIESDNRIPPRGFTNAGFLSVQAEPEGYAYLDEQYWDETEYDVPAGATRAAVILAHQTTTREYIEFLRDENITDLKGQEAYDLWVQEGMSAPIGMDRAVINFDDDNCAMPIAYGMSKTTSTGSVPDFQALGPASEAAGSFQVQLTGASANAYGILIASDTTASVPFMGGTRLVNNPFQRVLEYTTDANGEVTITVPVPMGAAGSVMTYQPLFRDGMGFGIGNAIYVEFCD